jgi:quercetin dioxygenase-like cupin family protein
MGVSGGVQRTAVTERETPVFGGAEFGTVGTYERLHGTVFGELDPTHHLNAGIVNLDRVARNARGNVEYQSDFRILKPLDLDRGNGCLVYDVPNRGNQPIMPRLNGAPDGGHPQHAGNGFLMRRGFTLVWSGWQGDVPPGADRLTARFPAVPSITGMVREEFIAEATGLLGDSNIHELSEERFVGTLVYRVLRDLVHLGFNQDLAGRQVFDGILPVVAGSRRTCINWQFAQAGRYSRRMAPPLKSLIPHPPTEKWGLMKPILCSLLVATLPFGSVLADAPKSKNAKVTLVYQHELPNVPGKSIKGVLVEYGPGGYSPGHTHPKSAFIYATVLEGAIRSQVNDRPVTTYEAGQSFSELPGDRHGVSANASKTKPAKLLAVFVVDTNETELTIPFGN